MTAALTTVLAFLFMVGFLVVVHEAGHFVMAKLFGVGVPVFSVGMGPRLFGFTYGGTDYRVSALPVGGYVQMSGADAFGEEDRAADVDPDEDFMRKPVWQRLLIMFAGPGVNLALPFVLFSALLMMGRPELSSQIGAVLPGTAAEAAGVRIDETIVAVDGEPVEVWHDVREALDRHLDRDPSAPLVLTLAQDGERRDVSLPPSVVQRDADGLVDTYALGLRPFYFTSRIGVDDPAGPFGAAGLETGDYVVAVDGVELQSWHALQDALGDGGTHEVAYKRFDEGCDVVEGTATVSGQGLAGGDHAWANPWGIGPIGLYVQEVRDGTPAERAGLRTGDRVLSVDGEPVLSFGHFIQQVQSSAPSGQTPRALELALLRDGRPITASLTPELQLVDGEVYERPLIGVTGFRERTLEVGLASRHYGFVEAVRRGAEEGVAVVTGTAAMLGNIFTARSDARKHLGGPIAIFQVAGQAADGGWMTLLTTTALISVSLGLINLLPVPVLDGGQILFYLVEAVRGRPLSLELRERVQMIGVVGLVILMLLVSANDIQRALGTGYHEEPPEARCG